MRNQKGDMRKYMLVLILLVVNFSFMVEECDGQFQWGLNYRLEALKLKEMLSHLRTGNGLKTDKIVRIRLHITIENSTKILSVNKTK